MMDAKKGKASKPRHLLTGATSYPPPLQCVYAAVELQAAATSRRRKPEDAAVDAHQDLIQKVCRGLNHRHNCLSPREDRREGRNPHIELVVVHQIQSEAPKASLIGRDASASPVH